MYEVFNLFDLKNANIQDPTTIEVQYVKTIIIYLFV